MENNLGIVIMYGVIVVGGGHAGCEAALASARMGVETALITMDADALARMSCNPSIGGMAKSHIVMELDAIGGEMARNADYTGIQFRVLNTRKGPSVRANRIQCDKEAYSRRMICVVRTQERIHIIQNEASQIWNENGKLRGVQCKDGSFIGGKTVVITAGTFLNGTIFIGNKSWPGGRDGEKSSSELSTSIKNLGVRVNRLKTGTPPRILKDSVCFEKLSVQQGDSPPRFLSREARDDWRERDGKSCLFHVEQDPLRPWAPGSGQIPCHITNTNEKTHEIIKQHLSESALYGGMISGTGVRYCPSIEDKIVKFSSQESHHVFIEPEGRKSDEIYPNGTSNSLPEHIQLEMIRSINGLEGAVFTRPGYAIEYDFIDPTQLTPSLESKSIENLFFAGQINGTTGYEEAAGQGFMAGVNAALKVLNREPLILKRSEAYIGVLIDDLVTKGTNEPYRMFTSRAEHRLILRQDNAAIRLVDTAEYVGIQSSSFIQSIRRMIGRINNEVARLESTRVNGSTLAQFLRRPEVSYSSLGSVNHELNQDEIEQIEISVKYKGYIDRELDRIARSDKTARIAIPYDFNYDKVKALRYESIEKLKRIRPVNLGQALRISGVNPSDIAILEVLLKR